MNLGTMRRTAEVNERARNREFYGEGRTQAEHNAMLQYTLPAQRSGRIKLVCTECEHPIGCTELIKKSKQRNADGKPLYRHRKCP